ncbi:hypothetical protein GGTG_05334 [Gaeumannomyces tritici R3-111a-1]|uniref:Uncharacterized protein n=1 Tax=Gaeumannomyces tritici (strain R3-111a-1) TaxID=644352 RepID=J3NVL9_GAET3|nr:hypothetical protein GGTG_05334 [Gaeumannomyces tritici R3-111a-1]EJT75397.1 hypothetical protein GGTG_05334 [Gaeumannomyces tritici R3-111a-1]
MAGALGTGEIPQLTHYREPSDRSTLADTQRARASIYIPNGLVSRIHQEPVDLKSLSGFWWKHESQQLREDLLYPIHIKLGLLALHLLTAFNCRIYGGALVFLVGVLAKADASTLRLLALFSLARALSYAARVSVICCVGGLGALIGGVGAETAPAHQPAVRIALVGWVLIWNIIEKISATMNLILVGRD